MNVSLRWLQNLSPDVPSDPEALSRHLAARGFPVEGSESLARDLTDLVVGRVEAVREHPNADRLRICDVDDGSGVVQVVCGAPNVEPGRSYPFAPLGATLPGGMTIGQVKLRGEPSSGMLCSERELGLGSDAGGLMELDGAAEAFRPGQSLVEALGLDDTRLDVEVTSNRPDLLSHLGMARECVPVGGRSPELPPLPGRDVVMDPASLQWTETGGSDGPGEPEGSDEGEGAAEGAPRGESEGAISIHLEAPELCPRYLGVVVRGVTVGPSPAWLQRRLRAAGARPVNNVVDATNFVLLELGQPLHAFDLSKIEGGQVRVRRARKGETIRTLDGVERRLDPDRLVIADARRPMAVAGVMGGEDSEVTESTTDLLLECALFTPGPIRATRKALGLSTDASYRYERGVDPDGLRRALARCVELLEDVAGGSVDGPVVDAATRRSGSSRVTLRTSRVERLLGVPIPEARIEALLAPLGFTIDGRDGDALSVDVPGFRSWDVTREVDLIEEIARVHGYDAFPDLRRPWRPGTVPDAPLSRLEDSLRDTLVARGLLEAQTAAFVPAGEGDVEVANPVNREEGCLRRNLVPGLLRSLAYNLARGERDVRLFEVASVFGRPEAAGRDTGDRPAEFTHLGLVLHGRRAPAHWSDEGETDLDVWDVRGLLEELSGQLGASDPETPGWRVVPAADSEARPVASPSGDGPSREFDAPPGASLLVVRDSEGRVQGHAGPMEPATLDLPRWAGTVWWIELRLPRDPDVDSDPDVALPPSHPGTERDLALLVPHERPAEEVLSLIRETGGEHLRSSSVFDVYEGSGVPDGLRSLAVRLHFRAEGRTLVDDEVDRAVDRVAGRLKEELGVGIRGG